MKNDGDALREVVDQKSWALPAPSEQSAADKVALVLPTTASNPKPASAQERGRFWLREPYAERYQVKKPVPAAPFLTRPPADTPVLLGYVKSRAHLDWIYAHHLYNLRADGRRGHLEPGAPELAAELLVLYGLSRKQGRGKRLWGV